MGIWSVSSFLAILNDAAVNIAVSDVMRVVLSISPIKYFSKLFNLLHLTAFAALVQVLSFLLLFYFWLRGIFLAARGLSLVVASGGCSSLQCVGFSLRWPLVAEHGL